MLHLWLRKELDNERRTPLSPVNAERLISAGFKVTVERSPNRVFPDEAYQNAGCSLEEPNSWRSAPRDAFILGLGALPGTFSLEHRHIYFGYAFKNQFGWENLLSRYLRGGGKLLDIEYIVDESGRRLASFGNTAGYVGMAAGILAWCRQELQLKNIEIPPDMIRQFEQMPLVEHLRALLNTAITFSQKTPTLVVMGANGLVGRGAVSLAEELKLPVKQWTHDDTRRSGEGPFDELLEYNILLNAIKLGTEGTTPFLTEDSIRVGTRKLSVVVDVSCDVQNPKNPLTIYHQTTTFDKPTLRVLEKPVPLDVIAIPTLPSLLPSESSRDFSNQLVSHLLNLATSTDPVWRRAEEVFQAKCRRLAPVPLPRHRVGELDVTLQQERLWKLHQLSNSSYNVARAAKLPAAAIIDSAHIKNRLKKIVALQEPLRTSFRVVPAVSGVRVVQVISSDSVAAAAKISVAEASVSSNEDLKTLLRDSSAKPFDLNAGSLARVILIRLPTGEKVVQVTLHQIIADYRSAGLFLRSVLDSTEFSASGELQYADFAHWERNRWVIERKFAYDDISPVEERETWQETQVGYWQTALDGSLHVLQLPTDSSRPATQNFDCTQVQYTLNAELASKVIELAKARVGGEHALFVLLASAFKVLLYRYCGEDDVIVGTTVAGRPLSSLRGLVGPFSNQLAVRSFIHDKMTFHEVVENIKTTIERGLLHQEVPFERLFEELRGVDPDAKKASTHNVLFHVKFNMLSQLEPEQIVVNEYTLDDISSSYDLELTINDRDIMTSGLGFEFVYNRNLFVADRIEEMFQQLDLLLTQIVKNFQSNIIAYNLVTDRARALVPNPAKDQDPTWRGPITEFFSKNARAEPNRIAVVYKDDQITYDVLEKATNQFASYLHRNGLQPGDVLAIYGHRSPAVVVAIMGILKAGCAYSMIDPAYPSTRIQQCCDIAKPRGWVRIENAGVPPQDLQVWLDAYPGLLQINLPQPSDANVPYKDDKDTFPVVEITADSVAVITFTSGSTGLPKGVMGRHGPLTHYYPWMAERFGLGRDDRFSMCSGIAHDPLQRDIFTPLFFGAAVYIPTQEDITTPGRLSEWMREKEISVTCMTPALGQILTTIDNPTFTIDSLRNAFFVGDMLIKRDVYRLIRLCPNIRVINMYGSTETQRSVGYFVVPNDEDELRAMKEVIPVGEGMQGCDVIILNSRMQLAGVGEVSEIYMRSHHLAKGYVGLDEQTKEKFIPNPFSGVKGDRLYKTGDLGRYAPNGLLECFGRADDQVKIRGFRIELGEINATLSLHPSVKENVTIVREDAPGEKRLVSYVVPTDLDAGGSRVSGPIDAAALSKELRGFLTKKLPNYMVPTYVVIIRAMPLTPNGKINRGGLPAPTDSVSDAVTAPPAEQLRPLTATEDKLLRVWARVLAVQVSSPEDNFFELGGHSILATRLMFEVGKELKMEKQLPMQLLFRAPTVASMAKAIDDLVAGAELSATSAAGPVIDLAKEATLEPSIDPASATPFDSTAPVKNILLTGATGFLGAFLLRGLLDQTETSGARVFCLARADTDDAAQKRLHKTLSLHLLWNDKYEHRIVPVAGDLSKPLLGLKQEKFDELARDVDVVIHNGALVHWLLPYEKLKPTNVNGTIEVLRLCSQTKQKALHHISTTSVFETDYHDKLKFVYEDDPLETFDGLTGGYGQSKWVAERLVLEAHRRGLPASIYRPGYVTGDSENGIWNTDDFLCRMIKGCIQLKAAPLLPPDATLDMSTVDYVCKTVAYLSIGASGEGLGKNYHLTNPNLYSYETLFGAVKSFGYDVELVEYDEWRRRLAASVEAGEDNALGAMVTFFSTEWPTGLVNKPRYDNKLVQEVTQKASINCPQMKDVLPVYFTYLIQCGFVQPPPEVASNILNIDWKLIGTGAVEMLSRSNRSK